MIASHYNQKINIYCPQWYKIIKQIKTGKRISPYFTEGSQFIIVERMRGTENCH